MIKSITKIGNSQVLIFDSALLDLARLKAGDRVDLTVHEGGTITLTPIRPTIESRKAATTTKRLIRKNSALFRRLS